jgi:hypothetical protein
LQNGCHGSAAQSLLGPVGVKVGTSQPAFSRRSSAVGPAKPA